MSGSERHDAIDAWRGAALIWMTAYHFGFDLFFLRLLATDFHGHPAWTVQRTVILSLFLGCAGAAQALALGRRRPWSRFWRRWAQVAGAAALVSLGSWLLFPRSFIYFGVLHALLLMLPLARLCTALRVRTVLLLALGLLAAYPPCRALLQGSPWAEAMNSPAWNWLGLVGRKPVTEDYVPVLPWIVPLLLGLAAGQWLRLKRAPALAWRARGPWRLLTWAGRHSLSWYLLHQPILIGSLLLVLRLAR